jgi:hypothetical protein
VNSSRAEPPVVERAGASDAKIAIGIGATLAAPGAEPIAAETRGNSRAARGAALAFRLAAT